MALVQFTTDTLIEYIYDYGQNIARVSGEEAKIFRTTSGLKLFAKKLNGDSIEMNIELPKKPNDEGSSNDFINALIADLSKEELNSLANKIKNLI